MEGEGIQNCYVDIIYGRPLLSEIILLDLIELHIWLDLTDLTPKNSQTQTY